MNNQYPQNDYSVEEQLSDVQSQINKLEESLKNDKQIIWIFIWGIVISLFFLMSNPISYDEEIEKLKLKDQQLEKFINENSDVTKMIVEDFIRK